MKKFWAWLLLSSSDPEKVSLTIKSAGAMFATYIIFFTGLFHKNIQPSDLEVLTNGIANFVSLALMAISAVVGVWAALRKIFLSLTGGNEVINSGKTL